MLGFKSSNLREADAKSLASIKNMERNYTELQSILEARSSVDARVIRLLMILPR